MADTTTTNFSYVLPQTGGSRSTWGGKLNQNWSKTDSVLGATVPLGLIQMFVGASSPNSYWKVCDGSALNTYTYKDLHAIITNNYGGTAFSSGVTDQSGVTTTFNLPDMRARVPVGYNTDANIDISGTDATKLSTRSLNVKGGKENVALTEAQLASHTHNLGDTSHNHNITESAHGHSIDAHNVTENDHTHRYTSALIPQSASAKTGNNYPGDVALYPTQDGGVSTGASSTETVSVANHTLGTNTTGITINDASLSVSATQGTGSDNAHENMAPFVVINYIILVAYPS
jgi:microcystin-dependent protein